MRKPGPLIWLAIITVSVLFVGYRFAGGLPLETNFLALLPDQSETKWVQKAKSRITSKVSRRIVISASHKDLGIATSSLQHILEILKKNDLVEVDAHSSMGGIKTLGSTMFPYRTGLLSPADRSRLKNGDGNQISHIALAQILSPFAMTDGNIIKQDPFLLFSRFLSSPSGKPSELEPHEGMLRTNLDGQHHVIASVLLKGEPMSRDFHTHFVSLFSELEKSVKSNNPDLTILKTGAVFYAEQSIRRGLQEASVIGGISLVGILLALLLVFKSPGPIFLSLLAVGAGLTCGMAATLLIFGQVHMMALIFGAGLLGIAVDYAIHYCCERFSRAGLTPAERLKMIFPGLTLGMISSVIGFLTLALAPFPGLQQIAIFSAIGLVASYITVVVVFPILDKAPELGSDLKLLDLASGIKQFWQGFSAKTINTLLTIIIIFASIAGVYFINPDDDVRRLQTLPIELRQQETQIRNLSGFDNAAQFFLISGKTTEDVLKAEEQLTQKLTGLMAQKSLDDYNAISSVIPSQARQKENRALVNEGLIKPHLSNFLETIGASTKFGYQNANTGFLTPQVVQDKGGATFLDLLTIQNTKDTVIHMVTLSGISDLPALETVANTLKNVQLIDHAKQWSSVLGTFRVRSLILLATAICLIWGFLSFRYGFLQAAKVLAPPVAAVVLTPLIITVIGGPFTFFNAMAMILVFVIGLDYALFYAEAAEDHKVISLFANGLSAVSTILAFGLMSFSHLYAVHAFGITILIGIALAFVLSPLAALKK